MVAGILEDLAAKLERHAGIAVRRERPFAISAEAAFRARIAAGRLPSPKAGEEAQADGNATADAAAVRPAPASSSAGEFDRVVDLLESYRQEKRRRAAKELNIESRKAALRDALRARALDEDRVRRAERIRAHLGARRDEHGDRAAGQPARLQRHRGPNRIERLVAGDRDRQRPAGVAASDLELRDGGGVLQDPRSVLRQLLYRCSPHGEGNRRESLLERAMRREGCARSPAAGHGLGEEKREKEAGRERQQGKQGEPCETSGGLIEG